MWAEFNLKSFEGENPVLIIVTYFCTYSSLVNLGLQPMAPYRNILKNLTNAIIDLSKVSDWSITMGVYESFLYILKFSGKSIIFIQNLSVRLINNKEIRTMLRHFNIQVGHG